MSCEYINRMPAKIILWGGTGQAKVVRPIIEHYDGRLIAVFDDTNGLCSPFPDIKLYHGSEFMSWAAMQKADEIGFCVSIGNPHGKMRLELTEKLINMGFIPITIAHRSAVIAADAKIGTGTQIMAGAVICPEVVIGRQCIINTSSSVDHECKLGDGVEIAPGATLCGNIQVENYAWIGAGATILPRLRIGTNSIVGAGAVVTKDVPSNSIVKGVPARLSKHRSNHE